MASTSSNLALRLPSGTDFVSVSLDITGNLQVIDDKWALSAAADIGAAAAAGSALSVARTDHVHTVGSGTVSAPGLPIGEANSGFYRIGSANIGATVAGVLSWAFSATGLAVETALALKHVASVVALSGFVKIFAKSDNLLYKHTAGGDEVRILDADVFTGAGTVLYGTAAEGVGELAAGTATQVLHSGTTPSWSAVATADIAANATSQAGIKAEEDNKTTTSATFVAMPDDAAGEMSVTLTTSGGSSVLFASFCAVATNNSTGGVNAVGFSLDGVATTDLMAYTAPTAGHFGGHSASYTWTGVAAGSHTVRVLWRVNSGEFSVFARALSVIELKK